MRSRTEEIEGYEEKSKFLRERGWITNWAPDNWIKEDRLNEILQKGSNPDWAGISTDDAYSLELAPKPKIGYNRNVK